MLLCCAICRTGQHQAVGSYEGTKGEWKSVLYEYILLSAQKFGTKVGDNILKWNSKYKLLDRLSEFGCDKPIGKTKLEEFWPSLKLELKYDKNGVLRAVDVDNDKYISNKNCVIISNGNEYLIITKDAETVEYEIFE